jgi:hypothetical protein
MGLEGDRHPVTKAPLDTVAGDAQEPGRRGRYSQAQGGPDHQQAVAAQDTVGQQLEPERHQRIR